MSINKSKILVEINQALDDYLKLQIHLARKIDNSYSLFWQDIHNYVLDGGKRTRSYLLILSYLSFGGQQLQDVLDIALSQEILHAALLIHDDIIDRDFIRHSKLNLAANKIEQYKLKNPVNAYHLGNSAALLGGDLLLSGSYDLILNCDLNSAIKIQLLKTLQKDIFLVGGGELMDMETFFKKYNHRQALKIIDYKTAMYSFYFPIKLASIVAKKNINESLLKKISLNLGRIYQLIDDLNNLFSTELIMGKPVFNDIRDNKKTYIISLVYHEVNLTNKKFIDSLMGQNKINQIDQKRLQNLILNSLAYQRVLELIDNLKIISLQLIKDLPVDNYYLEQFNSLINDLKISF